MASVKIPFRNHAHGHTITAAAEQATRDWRQAKEVGCESWFSVNKSFFVDFADKSPRLSAIYDDCTKTPINPS